MKNISTNTIGLAQGLVQSKKVNTSTLKIAKCVKVSPCQHNQY